MAHNSRSLGFVVSCDYAKRRDYAAICVAERFEEYQLTQFASSTPSKTDVRRFLHVRSIRRLGHSTYVDVNRILAQIVRALPGRDKRPTILVDATGGGDSALDYLKDQHKLRPIAISITGGDNENKRAWDDYTVPKRHLVEALAFAAESGDIRISADIEHGLLLEEELRAFTLKVRENGYEAFEGDRQHDDLVCCLMYVAWYGHKKEPEPARFIKSFHMTR